MGLALGSALDDCRFDKALPGDTGRESEASWQMVNPEVEEESEGSSGGEELPAKLPKIYTDDNVQARMRKGALLAVNKPATELETPKEVEHAGYSGSSYSL